MRRTASILIALLAVDVSAPLDSAETAGPPNIVLILSDDMGWSDIGCYGGEVETPNLDRLAAEGMRFTQFYNNAKCTTTRASLVTGLYPRRDRGGLLRPNMVTLGEVLKSAGYRTALSGKWHLGRGEQEHPHRRGFEEYYGLLDGCCNFFDPARPDPPYKGGKVRYFGHNDRRITEFPEGFYTTDAFTDHAIRTVRRFHGEGKPFFLHLCFTAPHYPLHAWPADIEKYRGRFRKGWETMRRDRYRRQIEMGLVDPKTWPLSGTDSRGYEWESAQRDFEDHRMAVYAAMIDRMDQNIGRLLRTLEELGVEENTLVLFLSDNGGCAEEPGGRDPTKRRPGPVDDYVAVGPAWGWAQNAPFRRYKSWVHEGGICTPLIARWPGKVPAGKITRQVGHIIDILPTLCEVGGAAYPRTYGGRDILPAEGTSLVPVLLGRERPPPSYLAWEWAGNRAYREGRWKAVWDSLVKRWELYDLETDRTETNDLAAAEPERIASMAAAWLAWAERTGLQAKDR
ncbi:MAG: arylsulfatase, partial [Planctomycetes bacterium]|nr:arylsulfatase [Planctomycetota bacterium]